MTGKEIQSQNCCLGVIRMPRGFTDTEKQAIQEQLMQAARERFARYGLRKTSVEELARAAGVSKGAFYLFYGSKEELYFDVMEQVESEIQDDLLEAVRRSGEPSLESFKRFIADALGILKTHPFFSGVADEDYQYLLRSIPPERLQRGISEDEAFAARLVAAWEDKGLHISQEPGMVSAVLRALVFVSLHSADFQSDVYPQMMDLLVDGAAERLVTGSARVEELNDGHR